jgi:NADPH-dependent curcumin reductase CurA
LAVQLKSRGVTLASRPAGFPKESDFSLEETEVARPGPGEVLVKALYVSVDPYQRGRMSQSRSYAKSLEIGDVITSQAVGEVVESQDPRFAPGDLVVGQLGWQEYAVVRGGTLRKLPPGLEPPTLALHVVGATGFTAYFGLFDVCRPKPGDTVVVSGAAGAVGQIVGQLARLAGCRTVGIAGGAEKKADLQELYGYDVAIDYKNEDVKAALPNGVDVYFDNVGGEISQAVHSRLRVGARIDYAHRFEEAAARLVRWVGDGTIRYREDITDGIENAPRAFIGMLNGENRGKALVRITGT